MVNIVVVLGCLLDLMIVKVLSNHKFCDPVTTLATGCLEQAQLCSVRAWALERGAGDFTNVAQVARWACRLATCKDVDNKIVAYLKKN